PAAALQQGNRLGAPIGNRFLYHEPVDLRAEAASPLPERQRVILADQTDVASATTLGGATKQLVGTATAPPLPNQPPTVITPAVVAQITDLVTQANLHYKAAYDALKRGDLTTFSTEMGQVGVILQQLQALTGTSSTSPSPSPKAS